MIEHSERWSGRRWRWTGGVLFFLMAPLVGILIYPAPLYSHLEQVDGFRVYSDRVPGLDVQELVTEVTERLAAIEHEPVTGRGSSNYKVFLCHSLRRYGFFARLTRRSSASQAIGLSAPGNIFVSMPRLDEFAEQEGALFPHSRFEGSPAFAIAHEIVHFGMIDRLGRSGNSSLPAWKSEGWADYQASLAGIRRDSAYDLAQRIDQLDMPGSWQDRKLRHRKFYAWQLMVEYLAEVKGYRLEDLARPEVDEVETWAQMRSWRRDQRASSPPA